MSADRTFSLDRYNGDKISAELSIVGGPHPYVWIGDEGGACFGTFDDIRALRDALTAALRNARRAPGGTP